MATREPTRYLRLSEARFEDIALIVRHRAKLREIHAWLQDLGPLHDFHPRLRDLANHIKIDPASTDGIIHALLGMVSLRKALELDANRFYDVLTENIELQASPKWRTQHLDGWKKARSQLIKALDADSPISISEKAFSLRTLHQHVFRDAQLITDLRPVFSESADTVIGTISTHSLIIDYYDRDERGQISITMEIDDIEQLAKLCERAKRKASVLKDKKTGLPGDTVISGEQ